MTPERLAKVAEVSAGHGDWESVSGGFRCHCGAITFDPDGHTAETLAPLLGEFQAEDEARGAARVRAAVWNVLTDLIADHPMWIGDDGQPLDYSPERESRIHDFIAETSDAIAALDAAEKENHDG